MPEFLMPVATWLENTLGLSVDTTSKIIWTLVVLAVLLIVHRVFCIIFVKRIKDVTRQYLIRKTITFTVSVVGLIIFLRVWMGGIQGWVAYLGILSAGLAIALQDLLKNFAGWMFIASRKPFIVGDRIQIGDCRGDVIDRRIFQFSLVEIGNWVDADQSTGRIIHLPNGIIFKDPVANYTQGFNFIWNELHITVTFESNWQKAKEILLTIAEEHTAIKSAHAERQVREAARKFLIFFQHLTPIVWTSVEASGVKLSVRYLSEPRKRRSSESAIWEAVLTAFSKESSIDFAYPTQRFYDHRMEGKNPEAQGDG